ncbi:alpha,alpha-phosphotrehalase [Aerococcus sanguinicola]|uniref:Alpha,alpha-phosphotrehalase n=1 Tax=Aerococcus sanguinicola TaxID=119206 RepID=A0A0X8FAS8_9LACT|nr:MULTISPECIES: alpha,alpha-phosphotrehalase [Aerococcus]AMB93946.1 glucohydrolase [Aerococcus sanguinicola]MDK7050576.1 alpha,alpha-phosphotrehalase [Aerococcus sanguinicola]OFT97371.1 alpha,alpha-phosphotrehalase [Aerococcus sp. HMSC23C02]PKZ21104.1 alpha,alpha-phosphotrehalase [Aerococcus sanguinicola]
MAFREMTVYQIYPKSFQDSDGDGFGDLRGIIQRLPYLEELGVTMIWLSPVYPSPQNDNGYDVSDYRAIDPRFGTMADFEDLVQEADRRGMGVMMDMVFNHTSTDHEWFQKALAGDATYQDYYILRQAKADGSLPTNWQSKFGGPAWEPFGDSGLYYLHLYDVSQADLDWHNPAVRKECQAICNFWLDKGVRGFRFDVLNVIGKDPVLVDGPGDGGSQEKALYTDTPRVHDWVRQLNQASFGQRTDTVTVGEMSSTSVAEGVKYTNPDRDELNMIFNFHHLKVDYPEGEKWALADFDFLSLKKILDDWQRGMSDGGGWNALFLSNHDQPRQLSRFGDPENYPYESATMLAQTIHLMRGTPYIFQGEELGMTNANFQAIEDYQDVETHNAYRSLLEAGKSQAEALAIVQEKSRDNARTPMQWEAGGQAGFTTGTPWLAVNDNADQVNAQSALSQRIFAYYQDLIQLRQHDPVISQGDYEGLFLDHPQVMAYRRRYKDQEVLVLSNFYAAPVSLDLTATDFQPDADKIMGNGPLDKLSDQVNLAPYETVAFRYQKKN